MIEQNNPFATAVLTQNTHEKAGASFTVHDKLRTIMNMTVLELSL